MLRKLLQSNESNPVGLDFIRVISGGIIVSFGFETFNTEQMDGYIQWLTDIHFPFPVAMGYIGKVSEFVFGLGLMAGIYTRFCTIPLMAGIYTRFCTIPLMATMCVINFIMLDGEIRAQPFYLLLIFASFFFIGSGKFSIDFLIKSRK